MTDSTMVDIKFSAGRDEQIRIQFEPLGTYFDLANGNFIFLRTPRDKLDAMQVDIHSNYIAVWLATPEDRIWSDEHIILDRDGVEIDRL